MSTLATKDPVETIVISFDFSLISGATVSNPSIEITRKSGSGTSNPSLMLSGIPQINGKVVS